MYCTKCGNKLTDNSRFCTKCGNKINYSVQNTNNTVLSKEQNQQSSNSISSLKKFFKKWWFLVLIISIVVVYGIFTDIFTQDKVEETISNNIINETFVDEETEGEKIAREEREKKKQEEKEKKEIQENIENTKWTLYATTEQLVKNRLKTPSTAKFLNKKAVYDETNKIYKVQGDVDAQNSFGAMIRSTFYAEYNNKLEMIYMTFDGEVLVNTK